jgi:group II intron reverse transcriptase/maturase
VQPDKWPMAEPPSPERLFSMNALRRAWNQVRRNGQSPGTDGVRLPQFAEHLDRELNRLRQQVIGGTYRPHPVRRFYIEKASGKKRPICIWAVRDRVLQRAVVDYMTPPLEALFMDCSYGFRPGRGIQDAVGAVVRHRSSGYHWVVDADIRDCFGSIDPALLMGQVRRTVKAPIVADLIEAWLYTPVQGHRDDVAGVSQGGVISPSLANLYLHRFDVMMLASMPTTKLVRFADDFITLSDSEDAAEWSLGVARRSLENLRLSMNMRKTRIVHFDDGFAFLGITFQGDTITTKDK